MNLEANIGYETLLQKCLKFLMVKQTAWSQCAETNLYHPVQENGWTELIQTL